MQRPFAKIQFNAEGTPVAEQFDDVYFSKDDAEAETRYVFIQHNDLPQRWLNHNSSTFVIAETGFGTGLNFLLAAQSLIECHRDSPDTAVDHLHFISTELLPLTQADLIQALRPFEHLELTQELVATTMLNVDGCHRYRFYYENLIFTLDLWVGDVLESLPEWDAGDHGIVDAWFLDGFAPSKNEGMWQQSLFDEMARLSKQSATFATFTAAGFVKRGLYQAGFDVSKTKGFGRKRDMLVGKLREFSNKPAVARPYHKQVGISYKTIPPQRRPRIAVIGGGIAAASATYSLSLRHADVTVFCAGKQLADGASGNPQAGIYPQLNASPSVLSQIQQTAFEYARQFYDQLLKQGYDFAHDWCGVLLVGFSETVRERQQRLLEGAHWPSNLIKGLSAAQASKKAGLTIQDPSLFIPDAGWASPKELVDSIFKAASERTAVKVLTSSRVANIKSLSEGVELSFEDQTSALHFDAVVVAAGHETDKLLNNEALPYTLTRGQVESIESASPINALQTVLCHKGYFTPAFNGSHALGSTYIKHDLSTATRTEESEQNIATHQKAMQGVDWIKDLPVSIGARAAIRCSTPDHIPIVGALPNLTTQASQYRHYMEKQREPLPQNPSVHNNIFVCGGLGSRGFTTAPLMAESLVSQMFEEPKAFNEQLRAALNPNRFLLRAIKRGEY